MGPKTKSMLLIALDLLEKSLKRELKVKRDAGRDIQAQHVLSELDDLRQARHDVSSLPSQPLSPSTVKNK